MHWYFFKRMYWFLLLLHLKAVYCSVASFDTRIKQNLSYAYTYQEGQTNPAQNYTNSGQPGIPNVFGNLTINNKRCFNWTNNEQISSSGLRLNATSCQPYSDSFTAMITSEFTAGQTRFSADVANSSRTITAEYWLRLSYNYPYTGTIFLLNVAPLATPSNSLWNSLRLTSLLEGTMQIAGTSFDTFSAASPNTIQNNIYHITAVKNCSGAFTEVYINTTSIDYSYSFTATDTLFFACAPPGNNFINNFMNGAKLFQGVFTLGSPSDLLVEIDLLMSAFYFKSLTVDEIQQNFRAGPPPSIPYSRTYTFTGVTYRSYPINFGCKDVDVDTPYLTVQIVVGPYDGLIYSNGILVTTFPFLAPVGSVVSYASISNVEGVNVDYITFKCFDSEQFSVLNPMNISLVFGPPSINDTTFIAQEADENIVDLSLPDVDPTKYIAVIDSLPQAGSSLSQYSAGCPGAAINSVPAVVTDSLKRVCLLPFPSSVYPLTAPLPNNNTGSGRIFVANVTFSYHLNSTVSNTSSNTAVVTAKPLNHQSANDFSTEGFERQLMNIVMTGTNFAGIPFGVVLLSLPSVGRLLTFDNQTIQINQTYFNTTFRYILLTINPGVIYFDFQLIEDNVRSWRSHNATVTINNKNTPHQPFLILTPFPADGIVAYTFNPIVYNTTIVVPDLDNWPLDRILHFTITTTNGIIVTFCLPFNTTSLLERHLSFANVFNEQIAFNQGVGCSDVTMEISAPYDQLQDVAKHLTIYGNIFLDTSISLSCCLYNPSPFDPTSVTCDPTLPGINYYTLPVQVFSKSAPSNSSNTFLDFFTVGQFIYFSFLIFLCLVCCILIPLRCVWDGTYYTCCVCCCCNDKSGFCNTCDPKEYQSHAEDLKKLNEFGHVVEERDSLRKMLDEAKEQLKKFKEGVVGMVVGKGSKVVVKKEEEEEESSSGEEEGDDEEEQEEGSGKTVLKASIPLIAKSATIQGSLKSDPDISMLVASPEVVSYKSLIPMETVAAQ